MAVHLIILGIQGYSLAEAVELEMKMIKLAPEVVMEVVLFTSLYVVMFQGLEKYGQKVIVDKDQLCLNQKMLLVAQVEEVLLF